MEKQCSKCGELKSLDQFYRRKSGSDQHYIYRKECKICRNQYVNEWVKSNSDKKKNYQKKYRDSNSSKITTYRRDYVSKKYNEDLLYRLKDNISNSIRRHMKSSKTSRTHEILDCTISFFIKYIESKFQDGMTWDNHGLRGWHLDHIIPLASAKNDDELIKLNHYTNFQPLWWRDNISKSDKIID